MAIRWIRTHGKEPVPEAMRAKLAEDSRFWYFAQLLILVSILFLWVLFAPTLLNQLFAATKNVFRHSSEGFVAAAILILARLAYTMLPNFRKSRLQEHSFASGPLAIWLVTFFIGGAVEEVWRACCILSLRESALPNTISIGGTSVAFAFAHMSGMPGRTVGLREEVLWEFLFGIALGTLFTQLDSLIAPYVASLTFNIFNLWLIRQVARNKPASQES